MGGIFYWMHISINFRLAFTLNDFSNAFSFPSIWTRNILEFKEAKMEWLKVKIHKGPLNNLSSHENCYPSITQIN